MYKEGSLEQEIIDRVAEHVSAVSANFHQNTNWHEIYETRKDAIGGFPGFWAFCAEAGIVFTHMESLVNDKLNLHGWEWIDAIDQFSDRLSHELWSNEPIPDQQTMREFASAAIIVGLQNHARSITSIDPEWAHEIREKLQLVIKEEVELARKGFNSKLLIETYNWVLSKGNDNGTL